MFCSLSEVFGFEVIYIESAGQVFGQGPAEEVEDVPVEGPAAGYLTGLLEVPHRSEQVLRGVLEQGASRSLKEMLQGKLLGDVGFFVRASIPQKHYFFSSSINIGNGIWNAFALSIACRFDFMQFAISGRCSFFTLKSLMGLFL